MAPYCTSPCSGAGAGDFYDHFGWSVALSDDGNTAVIGAPGAAEVCRGINDVCVGGAVWVFTRSGSTWTQQGSVLVANCTGACSGPEGTGQTSGSFGSSVALSYERGTALIGNGTGKAWIFTLAGSTWIQDGGALATDCTIYYCGGVALPGDGGTALVGAEAAGSDQPGTATAGAVWAFTTGSSPQVLLAVSRAGSGSGTVSGPGIDCPDSCSEALAVGTDVVLTAKPRLDSTFVGWSGGCSGTFTCL